MHMPTTMLNQTTGTTEHANQSSQKRFDSSYIKQTISQIRDGLQECIEGGMVNGHFCIDTHLDPKAGVKAGSISQVYADNGHC